MAPPDYLPQTDEARQEFAELHTAIDMLDSAIGRVLDALEKSGRADNTLVLFTADHGLPFQRAKGTLYEPGVAIPLIARWPGHITPGADTPAISSNVDIMPTLLAMAGSKIPAHLDGTNLLPSLRGETQRIRDWLHLEHAKCYSEEQAFQALTDGEWKYVWRPSSGREHLFNLEQDPMEERDLSKVEAHTGMLLEWRAKLINRL